jgi:hypothetical protein
MLPGYLQGSVFAQGHQEKEYGKELHVKRAFFAEVIGEAGQKAYQDKDDVGHSSVL